MLTGRSLIEPMDLSVKEMDYIFALADMIVENPEKFTDVGKGKLLTSMFYEPSTRTRLSFEAAMLRLGGQVMGFSEPNTTSATKGESVADTIRMVASYSDIAVMRHPREGAPRVASMNTDIPVINAGDGGHQHPTQTLTDLLTIHREKGRLNNLTVGLCGDLKFGRTVHSLIKALSRYTGVKFVLISPQELRVPQYVRKEILEKQNIPFTQVDDLSKVMGELDILYMTRIQRERFVSEGEYLRLSDYYILDTKKMKLAKPDTMILHPLPRVNEISVDVDSDPRAMYFTQAKNGMYVRMALIMCVLGLDKNFDVHVKLSEKTRPEIPETETLVDVIHCKNPNCITAFESSAPKLFHLIDEECYEYRCDYCDDITTYDKALYGIHSER